MSNLYLENIDLDNQEFQIALQLISETNQSVFLTGKAGTGKSTFLKYICSTTKKNYIILAPTGIAAVNVGGMTMHSFFKMPLKPLIPDDPDYMPARIRKTMKLPKDKVNIIKNLDMIIIDEISMVRADMIDFMDKVLRVYSNNMREPFGGKQLFLVGDIFQLEPVVTTDMRDILRRYYSDFFFFNAYAFSRIKIVPIELRKIYRQSDSNFISLLDKIRINRATSDDIRIINTRYAPNQRDTNSNDNFAITLASRRDTVDTINEIHLAALNASEHSFTGKIEGTFPLQNLPTQLELTLKVGAQVIFIRNDREMRWINGTIGKVSNISENTISVTLENGKTYTLAPEQWENMQYEYDEKAKRIKETVLGVFEQFPVKLAWALTIHKSQGLTFNNVIIDLSGGAFSSGQTYVALSRCTSLEGISLQQPIRDRDIIVNLAVVEFSKQFNSSMLICSALNRANASRLMNESSRAFDTNDFEKSINSFAKALKDGSADIDESLLKRFIRKKLSRIITLNNKIEVLNKTISEKDAILQKIASEYAALGCQSLELSKSDPVSVKSAIANFNKAIEIDPNCIEALIGKAEMEVMLDEVDSAITLYEKALSLDTNSPKINAQLAHLKYNAKNYPGALIQFKKAIRLDKNNPKLHDDIANLYDDIGLDDRAEYHREVADKLRKKK